MCENRNIMINAFELNGSRKKWFVKPERRDVG